MKPIALTVTLLATVLLAGSLGAIETYTFTPAPGLELAGTLWQWGGSATETILFGEDGFIGHDGWTARGLVTSWKVIDRRTVLLTIEKGRTKDRYAILTFDEDGRSYTGRNFHDGHRLAKSVELPRTATGRTLHAKLANSLWEWDGGDGEKVLFQADGLVGHPGWTARGLVTSWRVVDGHTVLLRIEKGRTPDHYAILIFDEKLGSFAGHNFHGQKLGMSRRIE
jgi:hypothetical protein